MTTPGFSPFELGQGAGSSISKGIRQFKDTSAIDEILSNAQSQTGPNAINEAMGQILSRVSPQNQERALAILQNRQKELSTQQQQASRVQAVTDLGLPESAAALKGSELNAAIKSATAEKEDNQKIQTAFDEMISLVPDIGFFKSAGRGVSGESRKKLAKFDTLNIPLEGALRKMVNTGRITDSQFKFLKDKLPQSNDSQQTIIGKLDAIASILKLDRSGLDALMGISPEEAEPLQGNGQSLDEVWG